MGLRERTHVELEGAGLQSVVTAPALLSPLSLRFHPTPPS